MGSPLDELRKVSTQVEKKKEENIKHVRQHKQLERDFLSKSTVEHKLEMHQKSKLLGKRSQKIKLGILITVFSIFGFIMYFTIRYIVLGQSLSMGKVGLVSDGFKILDATEPDYSIISSFIKNFTNSYKKNPSEVKSQWYHGLPEGKKIRYQKVLNKMIKIPGMDFKRIKFNKETGWFQVWYEAEDKASLTFNLVYDENYELKIVKIY